jgi:hypothetical protein
MVGNGLPLRFEGSGEWLVHKSKVLETPATTRPVVFQGNSADGQRRK